MAKDLITLDEYKDYAGISSIDFDDRIQSIITKISSYIKTYCNRSFVDNFNKATGQFTNIVEYTNEGGYYYTKELPINSVVAVEYSTNNGADYTTFNNFVLDKSKDAIFIDSNDSGINYFKVTYQAGYQKTPEDLKLACLDLTDYYYKGESVPRKANGNNTIEYVTSSDLPSHIKRVLDLYRVIL